MARKTARSVSRTNTSATKCSISSATSHLPAVASRAKSSPSAPATPCTRPRLTPAQRSLRLGTGARACRWSRFRRAGEAALPLAFGAPPSSASEPVKSILSNHANRIRIGVAASKFLPSVRQFAGLRISREYADQVRILVRHQHPALGRIQRQSCAESCRRNSTCFIGVSAPVFTSALKP